MRDVPHLGSAMVVRCKTKGFLLNASMPYNGSYNSRAASATAANWVDVAQGEHCWLDALLVNASLVHSRRVDATSGLMLRCRSVLPRALLCLAWFLAAAGWLPGCWPPAGHLPADPA